MKKKQDKLDKDELEIKVMERALCVNGDVKGANDMITNYGKEKLADPVSSSEGEDEDSDENSDLSDDPGTPTNNSSSRSSRKSEKKLNLVELTRRSTRKPRNDTQEVQKVEVTTAPVGTSSLFKSNDDDSSIASAVQDNDDGIAPKFVSFVFSWRQRKAHFIYRIRELEERLVRYQNERFDIDKNRTLASSKMKKLQTRTMTLKLELDNANDFKGEFITSSVFFGTSMRYATKDFIRKVCFG
jgi:hypothetical protein